jgi:hypothetical protein
VGLLSVKRISPLTLAGFTGCEWLGMTKVGDEGCFIAALKRYVTQKH